MKAVIQSIVSFCSEYDIIMTPCYIIKDTNKIFCRVHFQTWPVHNGSTTGFYMAKFNEICYLVHLSSSIGRYEQRQNPERQNPAIGGFEKNGFLRQTG